MKCLICIIPYFDLAVDQTAFDYLSHSLLRESLTSTKQAELHALYAEAAQNIYKETQGEAFWGEKNIAYVQYNR